ncbi:hypothetical protein MTR67_031613 [Solanum verrucosum]|uniref:Uncharacterized protein n=1 Tax=Solanum verrucosum TaxID=315347 RepID=A0AAF0U2T3_SOLVR|nr:hypothetical protein MTR67_031613 [Solanum verrucosum]
MRSKQRLLISIRNYIEKLRIGGLV